MSEIGFLAETVKAVLWVVEKVETLEGKQGFARGLGEKEWAV